MRTKWAILCFLFLFGFAASDVCGQSGAKSFRVEEVTKGMPLDQREALVQASIANAQGQFQVAVEILTPFGSRSDVHPAVLVFLGEMYEKLDRPVEAAKAFGAALSLWHQAPPRMPGNLQWKYGRNLLKAGASAEAIPVLLQALKQEGYEDDQRISADLVKAYVEAGKLESAYAAQLEIVCNNPLEKSQWAAFERLEEKGRTDQRPLAYPSASTWCPVAEIVDFGPPWQWNEKNKAKAIQGYLRAAEELATERHDRLSLIYLICVAGINKTFSEETGDYDPGKLLSAIDTLKDVPRPTMARYLLLLEVVQAQAAQNRMGHAVAALQDATDVAIRRFQETGSGRELDEIEQQTTSLARLLFAYVSFDPLDKRPRTTEADEFLSSAESDPRPMNDNYGSVSDDEDWADMFAVEVTGVGRFQGKPMPLQQIIESCLRQGKMEIPVKLMLRTIAVGGSYEDSDANVYGVKVTDIDARITNAPAGTIRPTTIEAFVLGKRLSQISARITHLKPVPVTSAEFSADGAHILAGTSSGIGILWDAKTGVELKRFADGAELAGYSPRGDLLLTAGSKTIRIYGRREHKPKAEIVADSNVDVARISPDGNTVAYVSGGALHLYDINNRRELRQIKEFQHNLIPISTVAFSPDGRLMAVGTHGLTEDSSFKIFVWDAKSGKELKRLDGHESTVGTLAFSADSRYLLSGSDDKTVRLWSVTNWQEVRRYEGHSDNVVAVSFSADGKLIAAASWDKSILVWDRESGAVVKKVENNGWWFSAVSFSSDGKLLVAASYDGTVQVLDPNTGKNILRLHVPKK